MGLRRVAFVATVLFHALTPGAVRGQAAAPMAPADHPLWRWLEEVCAARLTREACPDERPVPRERLEELTSQAREALNAGRPANARSREALHQLERWLHAEPLLRSADGTREARVRMELAARDGDSRALVIDAETQMRLGRPLDSPIALEDRGIGAAVRVELGYRRHLAASATMTASQVGARVSQAQLDVLFGNRFVASGGRLPLTWGASRRGSLLVNTGAQAVPGVRLAVWKPWHGLGAELVAFRLEDERGHPWWVGQRLTWSPLSFVTVGAQRAVLCCEAGSGVTLRDVPEVFLARHENESGHRLDFDQLASVSARVDVPVSPAMLRLYGEYAGTDVYGFDDVRERGGVPHLLSRTHLLGGLLGVGRVSLRAEVADLDISDNVNAFFHRRYPLGHSYLHQPLAHPVGGRGQSVLFEARVLVGTARSNEAVDVSAFALRERFGLRTPAALTRITAGASVDVPAVEASRVRLSIGVQGWEDRAAAGERTHGAAVQLRLRRD